MPHSPSRRAAAAALVLLATLAACSSEPVGIRSEDLVVLSVVPAGGATGVSTTAPIVVAFNHPMMPGADALVALHEGTATGPLVDGTTTWSADRTTLTFTPSAALRPATTHVLHLAPSLADIDGRRLSHAGCAALGGRTVTGGMMGGGAMGGGAMGPGSMGPGWEMSGGGYGMSFTFTTA